MCCYSEEPFDGIPEVLGLEAFRAGVRAVGFRCLGVEGALGLRAVYVQVHYVRVYVYMYIHAIQDTLFLFMFLSTYTHMRMLVCTCVYIYIYTRIMYMYRHAGIKDWCLEGAHLHLLPGGSPPPVAMQLLSSVACCMRKP